MNDEGVTEGRCEKCDSVISTEAKRCPECGYEPSSSILVTIIGVISIPLFLFCLLLLIIVPITMIGGSLEFTSGLVVIAIFGVGALFFGAILWAWQNQDKRTPTDSSITGS
jgi:hypothetical protein